MAEVAIGLLLLTAVTSALTNRGLLNPVTITLGLFTVVTLLAHLRLYGLYAFPDIAYRIVLVGCLSLLAGSIVAHLLHAASLRNPRIVQRRSDDQRYISYRLLDGALLIAIVTIVVTRREGLAILGSGGSLADVRNSYLGYAGSDQYVTSVGALLGRVIVSPVLFAALPVFVHGLVEGSRNRRFGLLFLVAVVLNLATSGGRMIFVYAVVQLLVLLAINDRLRIRMSRGRAVALTLGLLSVVTVMTIAKGNALFFEAYTYFAIPVPLLAHWATVVDANGVSTDGAGFAFGVLTLVANAVALVEPTVTTPATDVVNQPQDVWVELLPGRPFNAFVTLFYYFYADFKMPGVVLLSGIYGFAAQTVYDRARAFGGVLPKLLLLLTIQSVVMSFVRWQATDGAYILAFALLLVVVRRRTPPPMPRPGARSDGARAEGP